nr:PDZ domain-containing protein [Acidobacteriota bacterium]
EAAPAPLARLAAEATYEELASIMADLERRIAPRVAVVHTTAPSGTTSLVVAPRIAPDRAVVLTRPEEQIESVNESTPVELVAHDAGLGVGVLRVPAVDDGAVPIRTGVPRPGPRYVGVVEGTPQGPVLRPVYVGRMQLVADARTGAQQMSLVALQHAIPPGAAIFTLDGNFIGLVRDAGETTTVLTGEFLRATAGAAPPAASGPRGSLGVELDPLTPALARATGADRGVVVVHVHPGGPAAKGLQSGDVIQSIDGTAITTVGGFREVELTRTPGASVTVRGLRRAAPLVVVVTAADAAAAAPTPAAEGPGFIGRNVAGAGTEVVTVTPRSAAAAAGLEPGDLILAVDGRQGPAAGDMIRRYRAATPNSTLLITIQRGPRHHVLALEKR